MISATATLQATITATATLMAVQTGSCAAATVENTDSTYSVQVASGGTLVLADTTYVFQINGVNQNSVTVASMIDYTFNINFVP